VGGIVGNATAQNENLHIAEEMVVKLHQETKEMAVIYRVQDNNEKMPSRELCCIPLRGANDNCEFLKVDSVLYESLSFPVLFSKGQIGFGYADDNFRKKRVISEEFGTVVNINNISDDDD